MTDDNWVKKLSDDDLVQAFSQTGDPWAFEMLKAEQNRRSIERTQSRAIRSEKIAVASLIVAILSMIVAIVSAIPTVTPFVR